jgi:hypothetical protein
MVSDKRLCTIWYGLMTERIVDVFRADVLVKTYAFDLARLHRPAFDHDLIERAKVRLRRDGYAPDEVERARFAVRIGSQQGSVPAPHTRRARQGAETRARLRIASSG